ncbi:MAG: insulinase family protein [Firmicutes bacterium]|nr:insulinase family protein [Bacillota bacterium]
MKLIRDRVNLYVENNKNFKGSYLCICFKRPLEKGTVTKNRLLSLVLGSGCERYKTPTQLNSALAECNGAQLKISSVKRGDTMVLRLLIAAPKGSEERQFAILSEIINRPYLRADDFAVSCKKHLKNLIENKPADKRHYALDRCTELMFEKTAHGIDCDGILGDLCGIKDLYGYYKSLFANAGIDVFVLGDIDEGRAKELFDKYFPDLKTHETPAGKAAVPCEYRAVTERLPGEHAKLCVGVDMGEGSRFEKMVFNELFYSSVLGSMKRGGLCRAITSRFYTLLNAMLVQADIEEGDADKAVSLIKSRLEKKSTPREIDGAKAAVTHTLELVKKYPTALMDFYLIQGILDDKVSPEKAIDKVKAVDRIDLHPRISVVYLLGSE